MSFQFAKHKTGDSPRVLHKTGGQSPVLKEGKMEESIQLQSAFPIIKDGDNVYYGGAQQWWPQQYVRGYGCGVVGCANLLLTCVNAPADGQMMSKEDYVRFADKLRRKFLPVIPKFGMNGLVMAAGMHLYFKVNNIPMSARWGCAGKNLYAQIGRMLREGIPVVLAIGPNSPNLFGKHRLNLYRKRSDAFVLAETTKAHYVTVTGMDDKWLKISSWGREYYLNRSEYDEYVKKHSNRLFSSIMVITKKKKG